MSENQQGSDQGSQMQQKASHWSELISKVIEKVIDKDVSVTYTFDHLEVDVPSAHGPGGRDLGGAKWVIDGKITISTTSLSSPSSPAHSNAASLTTSSPAHSSGTASASSRSTSSDTSDYASA
jgi:hypothetical protein